MWLWSIHSCFQRCKIYKNSWPRNVRVLVENKVAPFFRTRCIKRVMSKCVQNSEAERESMRRYRRVLRAKFSERSISVLLQHLYKLPIDWQPVLGLPSQNTHDDRHVLITFLLYVSFVRFRYNGTVQALFCIYSGASGLSQYAQLRIKQ